MNPSHDTSRRPARITIVAAVAQNGVIGRAGGLPWHLPDDLAHFKRLTKGQTCIMGRKTFDEVERTCGGPLPNRRCIVVTRSRTYAPAGIEVVHELDDAFDLASDEDNVCVIGGAQIYTAAMDNADFLEITIVHGAPEGDTVFPIIDSAVWELVAEQYHPPDERHEYAMTFRTYERK